MCGGGRGGGGGGVTVYLVSDFRPGFLAGIKIALRFASVFVLTFVRNYHVH